MRRGPIHPLLVHFPLALLGVSFVFDVLSLRLGAALARAARFDLEAGLVAAALTAAAGLYDYFTRLPRRSPARRLARVHATLNLLATALFAASLVTRFGGPPATATAHLPLFLSSLGVLFLGVAGYLGGVLVVNTRRATR